MSTPTAGPALDPALVAGAAARPSPMARQVRDLLLVLIAGLALLTAGTFGYPLASAGAPPAPASDSPEAGFARDMSAHHAQAVHMSFLIWDASRDPELRFLAYDVITSQQAQIGMICPLAHRLGTASL